MGSAQVKDSALELRSTKKYGDIWYMLGADDKWYTPINAYMAAHQKDPQNKDQFKDAIHDIAEHFGFEVGEGKEKKESVVDESEIVEVASKLLRIGGKWYKKARDPLPSDQWLPSRRLRRRRLF